MNELESWESQDIHSPSASIHNLRKRAELLASIRNFFATKNVLEVETPLMSHHTVTDPHVVGIPALFKSYGAKEPSVLYLQTSPEYAMKRLLAAGSGAIYQITKAFRQGDLGHWHNPEFTMLEWYRPGFDHHQLMDEVDALLQLVLTVEKAERVTYADIFLKYLGFNPHEMRVAQLKLHAERCEIPVVGDLARSDDWLDLLWTHVIEPQVGLERPLFVYDFPVSQAALAKIRAEDIPVASRFEVYFKGVELANGFHELQEANEQLARFEKDLAYRRLHGLPEFEIDKRFIAALQKGIPDCAGVALGVDRLVMLALGCEILSEVISFSFHNA